MDSVDVVRNSTTATSRSPLLQNASQRRVQSRHHPASSAAIIGSTSGYRDRKYSGSSSENDENVPLDLQAVSCDDNGERRRPIQTSRYIVDQQPYSNGGGNDSGIGNVCSKRNHGMIFIVFLLLDCSNRDDACVLH